MSIRPEEVYLPLKALKEPLKLGPLTMRNRLVMASLTRNRAVPDDYPNEYIKEYYAQRAKGKPGLIMSEGTLTSMQGTEWPNVASIYSSKHAEAWKEILDAVHETGTPMFAQLWHVGRVAHPDMPLQKKFGKPVSAPSPIAARGGKFRTVPGQPGYVKPEREHPNPWELVDEYKRAAEYAKQAGFDGAEFHGANGYLPAQFLDKNTNHRTDMWGGSLENRARFYVECLKVICEVFGSERVGIKLNPCGGYNDIGMNEEDTIETFSYIIKHCVSVGLAYVQLVRYLPHMDFPLEGGKMRAETHLDVLEAFEPIIHTKDSRTKLFLNGDVSAEEGDKLIKDGKVDAVVIGRSFIDNPDLPFRLFNGLPLNETLGHPLQPHKFYAYESGPDDGYTDYPDVQTALMEMLNKTKKATA